jgi:hypothetical protein
VAGKESAANENLSDQLAKIYPKCPAMAGSDNSDTISLLHREKITVTVTDISETYMNITNQSQPFRFTKENARENAVKSWQARRERKAKLEAEAQQGRQSTPQSERLALQIERVERMMDKTKDPDALQKLSATHARLFNAWQILTGTPNPGSRRNRGSRSSLPANLLPVPTPQGILWQSKDSSGNQTQT